MIWVSFFGFVSLFFTEDPYSSQQVMSSSSIRVVQYWRLLDAAFLLRSILRGVCQRLRLWRVSLLGFHSSLIRFIN